jgi:hypothetical protein
MDLRGTGSGTGPETYSARQLRLHRQFLGLLQRSSPGLLRALEVLVGELLEDGAKKR